MYSVAVRIDCVGTEVPIDSSCVDVIVHSCVDVDGLTVCSLV